jgi:hypothetical protein
VAELRWEKNDAFDEAGRRIGTVCPFVDQRTSRALPRWRYEAYVAGERLLDDDGVHYALWTNAADARRAVQDVYDGLVEIAGDPAGVPAFSEPGPQSIGALRIFFRGMGASALALVGIRPRGPRHDLTRTENR